MANATIPVWYDGFAGVKRHGGIDGEAFVADATDDQATGNVLHFTSEYSLGFFSRTLVSDPVLLQTTSSNTKWLQCKPLTSSLLTASRMPVVLLQSGSARISTGLRKNRNPQIREAFSLLCCSFSPGVSRAVFSINSVRRFLGLGKSDGAETLQCQTYF